MEWVIAYVAGGIIATFIRGYIAPIKSAATPTWQDWAYFVIWPLNAVPLVLMLGVCVRRGWKE